MLSQKARYALRAMIELGRAGPNAQLTAGEIASRADAPRKFLEAILLEPSRRHLIISRRGKFGGYALYVKDGKPTFTYNWGDSARYTVTAAEPLPPGKSTIVFDFAYDGGKPGAGGTGTFSVNGKKTGEGRIDRTMLVGFSFDETFDIGEDTGTPAGDYQIPFRFTGKLEKVTFDLKGTGHSPVARLVDY